MQTSIVVGCALALSMMTAFVVAQTKPDPSIVAATATAPDTARSAACERGNDAQAPRQRPACARAGQPHPAEFPVGARP